MADDQKNRLKDDERISEKEVEKDKADDAELDEALDETFPASDPVAPSRIDGPNN
ncbi:hypothetical protein [Jiella endophytica]|uniref:hypothetical protein n=1 Tax=Jiella endophytica TaxID=2558362 RepID=UPI00142F86BF|nr:hypothetical protein [Jiella endophytica]